MKPLPLSFSEKGYNYKQVRRNDHVAMYRQTWGEGGSTAYEVVIPQTSRNRFINGSWQRSEPYERYPSTAQWGDQGWTLPTEERANAKFEGLTVELEAFSKSPRKRGRRPKPKSSAGQPK